MEKEAQELAIKADSIEIGEAQVVMFFPKDQAWCPLNSHTYLSKSAALFNYMWLFSWPRALFHVLIFDSL